MSSAKLSEFSYLISEITTVRVLIEEIVFIREDKF